MYFVKTADLKTGMRLARPIYNAEGVLLFERDTKLTEQEITTIHGINPIGVFVLEPAEPAPPMTDEDANFEQFQVAMVSMIQEEMNTILKTGKAPKTHVIVSGITKEFGHLGKKINFNQNMRSREDYIYKHALNTAILCAMITNRMNMKVDERIDTLTAAVTCDIGKLGLTGTLIDKVEMSEADSRLVYMAVMEGVEILDTVLSNGTAVKRICSQAENALCEFRQGKYEKNTKMVMGAKVLLVADAFEKLTAMQVGREPDSEIKAIRYLQKHSDIFDEEVVKALMDSVHILASGVSVELNTGEKALVLNENPQDALRPMVLCFKDNTMMDLSNGEYDDIEIVDVVKTMDNRHVLNTNTIKNQEEGN